jgi:hypothetical protein
MLVKIQCSSPLVKATFVPGRMRTYMSPRVGSIWRAVRVSRGSTTMSLALLVPNRAALMCAMLAGWFSAGLAPNTKNRDELSMSVQWFVIEPRPNARPRPATVDECHIRA